MLELLLPMTLLAAALVSVLLWARWRINAENKEGER
jgi:hypothetical protein